MTTTPSLKSRVDSALALLRRAGSARVRDERGPRFGIHVKKAFGVPMGDIQRLGRQIGRDDALAEALWKSGWYEGRLLALYVADPSTLSLDRMERWCRDFDNWGICDTACFCLFDRSPQAYGRIEAWADRKPEFERRAAFALIASLAGHDTAAPDAPFWKHLVLIERASTDDRNFVKKGVNWALRAIGNRSPALHDAAIALSKRLAASEHASARWIGKDALRDLSRPLVAKRVAAKAARAKAARAKVTKAKKTAKTKRTKSAARARRSGAG